ncbi:MAG: hypothetical protein KDF65_14360 [Anaerolineae bacterium]|nr:hypothetical protein [Anaerolineae bacterium]
MDEPVIKYRYFSNSDSPVYHKVLGIFWTELEAGDIRAIVLPACHYPGRIAGDARRRWSPNALVYVDPPAGQRLCAACHRQPDPVPLGLTVVTPEPARRWWRFFDFDDFETRYDRDLDEDTDD